MAGRIERRWPILAVVVACGGSLDTTLGDASDDGGGTDSTVGDAGEPDATVSPCGKGEVLCGNTCYPDDVDHCGPACAQCGAPTNGVATCDGKICGFTCNVLQCGSTCVDPSKDSHNCGACGHDCLATQCSGGQCQPELLYGIGGINYLAGDAVNLYWTGPGGVLQGPKGGGTAKSILAQNVQPLIAVDSKNVYAVVITTAYTIGYVPIGGGTFTPLITSTVPVTNPALDSQYLYFGNQDPPLTISAVPLDGGSGQSLLSLSGNGLVHLFRGGASVYATPWTGNFQGSIVRFSASDPDAGVETLFEADASQSIGNAMAFDDAGTTAIAGIGADLVALGLDGGPSSVLATAPDYISCVAMDRQICVLGTRAEQWPRAQSH